jgi:hypothetical protein
MVRTVQRITIFSLLLVSTLGFSASAANLNPRKLIKHSVRRIRHAKRVARPQVLSQGDSATESPGLSGVKLRADVGYSRVPGRRVPSSSGCTEPSRAWFVDSDIFDTIDECELKLNSAFGQHAARRCQFLGFTGGVWVDTETSCLGFQADHGRKSWKFTGHYSCTGYYLACGTAVASAD